MASTRDRIIVASNELFRRYGYRGTSLSHISEAADATVGSIYHFFPGGKEALAVAVIDTTGAVYRELFESFATDPGEPLQAFDAFFAEAAHVLETSGFIDPCPIGTVARETASTNEPLRLAAERAFTSWVEAARSFLSAAGVDDDNALRLAMTFVATTEGAFVLSRTLRDTAPVALAGRSVTSALAWALESADAIRARRATT